VGKQDDAEQRCGSRPCARGPLGEGVHLIYIDSSCLIKIFRPEPESPAVLRAIGLEPAVTVSALAELEVMVQLKADYLAGKLTRPAWRQLEARFSVLRQQEPFEFRPLPAALFRTALRQHRNAGDIHCRSIDRLHLAAIEELGLQRLMTHDIRQAKAATEAGFEVVRPGRG
jgi:predicted nucleic acid-binding protein